MSICARVGDQVIFLSSPPAPGSLGLKKVRDLDRVLSCPARLIMFFFSADQEDQLKKKHDG